MLVSDPGITGRPFGAFVFREFVGHRRSFEAEAVPRNRMT